jgi:hypothetical protein
MDTVRRWVIEPFVRGLGGLPLVLAAIPMAAAGRTRIRLIRRYPVRGDLRPGRVLAYGVLVLVPAVIGFAAAVMQAFVTWSGYLYPLRPDTIAAIGHPFTPDRQVLANAWGGPTLAGAWAVHSCVAFGFQAVCALLLLGSAALQDGAARRLLQ